MFDVDSSGVVKEYFTSTVESMAELTLKGPATPPLTLPVKFAYFFLLMKGRPPTRRKRAGDRMTRELTVICEFLGKVLATPLFLNHIA